MSRKRKRSSSPQDPATGSQLPEGSGGPEVAGGSAEGSGVPADFARSVRECDDPERRLHLAARAIEQWPDCAEAYLCLAEMAPEASWALDLYRLARDAASRQLTGSGDRDACCGQCGADPRGQAYLQASLGIARTLWSMESPTEAIDECRAVLARDPRDEVGARRLLSFFLLQRGDDAELAALLDRFPADVSTEVEYTRALVAYRRERGGPAAQAQLQRAHRANPHVAELLLCLRSSPDVLPEVGAPGDESEAILYAADYRGCWRDTEGALPWLRETLGLARCGEAQRKSPPWTRRRDSLREIPQDAEAIWEVDLRRFGNRSDRQPQPWTVLALDQNRQLVAIEPIDADARPTPRQVLEVVLKAMRRPQHGDPRRPAVLRVRQKALQRSWEKRLQEVGIECRWCSKTSWIDEAVREIRRVERTQRIASGELARRRGELDRLEIYPAEVWQADVVRMACWIHEHGEPKRPWLTLVTNRTSGLILTHDLSLELPDAESLWEAIQRAMLANPNGDPHRPAAIEVASADHHRRLNAYLEPLGVKTVLRDHLDHLMAVKDEMEATFRDEGDMAALVDMPRVTAAHVAGAFDAAADFYLQRPWRRVAGDVPIRLDCEHLDTRTWYAVVMGQSGLAQGLALYEEADVLRSLLQQDSGADRRNTGLSLLYGESFELAPRDLDAAERLGWRIAGPQAYPLFVRLNPGMVFRSMLAWELELTEAALRAIPQFLGAPLEEQRTIAVPTAAGERRLRLSWWDPRLSP